MVIYGLNEVNQRLIEQKAKTKRDGCYQLRGVAYRVRSGRVTHVASAGRILETFGHFNVAIGEYAGDAKKALEKL